MELHILPLLHVFKPLLPPKTGWAPFLLEKLGVGEHGPDCGGGVCAFTAKLNTLLPVAAILDTALSVPQEGMRWESGTRCSVTRAIKDIFEHKYKVV